MAGRHARRSARPRLRRALVAGAAVATAVTCILTTSPAPQPASPARMDLVPAPALHLEAQEPTLEKTAPQPLAVVADQRLVKTPVGDVFAEEEPSQCVSLPLQPGSYRISSPYGYRTHPISGTWSLHAGTDYAAPPSAPPLSRTPAACHRPPCPHLPTPPPRPLPPPPPPAPAAPPPEPPAPCPAPTPHSPPAHPPPPPFPPPPPQITNKHVLNIH